MLIKGVVGNFAGQEFQVNGSLVFGRSPQGCNVLFPDNVRGVSRTHCKVDMAGGGATLTDMGSSYGTFLNGRKLAPYTPTPLNNGDTFWLGGQSNSFSFMDTPAVQPMNMAMAQQAGMSKNKGIGIIIGSVAAGLVIIILTGAMISMNNQAKIKQQEIEELKHERDEQQQMIDDFNNRSPIERIVDGVEGAFDLFH